jgi:hypothetical protein
MHRDDLYALADRCEAGADTLTYEADHAGEVFADAGYPDADPAQWATDKHRAATAAREYAAGLRAQADRMSPADRVPDERLAQAEKVALAAEMGGILIDGHRLVQAAADHAWSPEEREAILAHQQADRDAVDGSGLFTHVDQDGQVPYWQLAGPADTPTTEPADVDDVAGRWSLTPEGTAAIDAQPDAAASRGDGSARAAVDVDVDGM